MKEKLEKEKKRYANNVDYIYDLSTWISSHVVSPMSSELTFYLVKCSENKVPKFRLPA